MRITTACPEGLIKDANCLAMVLAYSAADAMTYRAPTWTDADDNHYAVASWEVHPDWLAGATSTLARPKWDTGKIVNMTGAARAQAAMVFWSVSAESPEPPRAAPDRLTAVGGMDGQTALAAMGLTPLDVEPWS
jgi:hypothetical protein